MTEEDKGYFGLLRAQLEVVRQQVQLLESRIRCVESDFETYRRSSPADRIADLTIEAASRLTTRFDHDDRALVATDSSRTPPTYSGQARRTRSKWDRIWNAEPHGA